MPDSIIPGDEPPPCVEDLPGGGAEVRGEAARGGRHRDRVEVAQVDEGGDEVDEGDEDELAVDPHAGDT